MAANVVRVILGFAFMADSYASQDAVAFGRLLLPRQKIAEMVLFGLCQFELFRIRSRFYESFCRTNRLSRRHCFPFTAKIARARCCQEALAVC